MANFNEYLSLIKNAVYGKDVRTAIHDALLYLNNNSNLNLDFDKVVRADGYEDEDILNFLHIDLNKKVTPVPLLGSWFKLGTDDEGNVTGLDFSTNGRIQLLKFVHDALIALEIYKTMDATEELDSLAMAYSVYYPLDADTNANLWNAFNGAANGAFVSAFRFEAESEVALTVQIALPVSRDINSQMPAIATRYKVAEADWSTWNTSGTGAGGESNERLIDSYKIYIENNNQMIEATEPPASASDMNGALFSGQLIQSLIRQAISGLNLGEAGAGLTFKGEYDGLEGSHYYPGDIVYNKFSVGMFLCCTEVQDGNVSLPPFGTLPFSTSPEGDIVWIRLNYMSVPLPNNIDSIDFDNKLIRLKKGPYNQIRTEIVSPSIFTKTNITLHESDWQMNDSPYADYPYSYMIRWDEIAPICSVAVFSASDDIFRIGDYFAATSDATEKYVFIYSKRAIDVNINMLIATTGGEA